jgi:hypothetical protein
MECSTKNMIEDCQQELLPEIEEEFEALMAIYEDDGVIEEAPHLTSVNVNVLEPPVTVENKIEQMT